MALFNPSFSFTKHAEAPGFDEKRARKELEKLKTGLQNGYEIVENASAIKTYIDLLHHKIAAFEKTEQQEGLLQRVEECRSIFQRVLGSSPDSESLSLDSCDRSSEFLDDESATSSFFGYSSDEIGSVTYSPDLRLEEEEKGLERGLASPLEVKEKALQAASKGDLARLLWLLTEHDLPLKELSGSLEEDVYTWLEKRMAFDPAKESSLDAMALGLGWGYKAANLVVLQRHSLEVSELCATCEVRVPNFLPVSDLEMRYFIQLHYPQLDEDWQRFIASFPPQEERSQKGLLESSSLLLEQIRTKILKVFQENSYDTPQLQQWIKKERPEFLIVRSTGKEDTESNSNAGGNHTEALVRPNSEAISEAMGKVLSSYFGEKSILQRIANKDASVFTDKVFLPVLIQTMVSEPTAPVGPVMMSEIPRSGVMFSNVGGKPSMTQICVGLGLNEGVVSSMVNTDRYLIDSQGNAVKVIRDKDTRFVAHRAADGHDSCEVIPTVPRGLRTSPALTDQYAADMRRVSDFFSSKVYGTDADSKAMDMEFTLIGERSAKKPIIYLLQARPLKALESSAPCTYIDTAGLEALEERSVARGETLLDGGSYVRDSVGSKVIVCDTIEQAETLYNKSSVDDQAEIKTVIIRKPAPATSHQAVNLRALAIVIVEDEAEFKKVKSWSVEKKPFTVDPQRGVVVEGVDIPQSVGTICYPMPLEYSMVPSRMILNLEALRSAHSSELEAQCRAEMKAFGERIQALTTSLESSHPPVGSNAPASIKDWRRLLDRISLGSASESQMAAAQLLRDLQREVKGVKILAPIRLELLMLLEEVANIIEKQLIPATQHPPQSLERLYPVRLLEACLFQRADIIGGFSFRESLLGAVSEKKIVEHLSVSIEATREAEQALLKTPFIRAELSIIKKEDREVLRAFIQKMEVTDNLRAKEAGEFLQTLGELGVLTEWANTELVRMMKSFFPPTGEMDKIQIEAFLEALLAIKRIGAKELTGCKRTSRETERLHSQMSSWEMPSYVEANGAALIKTVSAMGFNLDVRDSKSLINRFKRANGLEKLAILQTSQEAIAAYDEIIKRVKGSTQYSNPMKQAAHLKALLDEYRLMMRVCLAMAAQGPLNYGIEGLSISEYLHRADAGGLIILRGFSQTSPGFDNIDVARLDNDQIKQHMLPSEHFNVSSVVVSGTGNFDYARAWPVTLEDYFTFFHQNMEACMGMMRKAYSIPEKDFPSAMQSYFGSVVKSTQVVEGQLQVISTTSLRSHAVNVQVSCDPQKTHPIFIKMDYVGASEHSRWEYVATALASLGDIPLLKIEPSKINYGKSTGLSVEFVDQGLSSEHRAVLQAFIEELNEYTGGRYPAQKYLDCVSRTRLALGGKSGLPFGLKELEKGAFFLAPTAIDLAIKEGRLEQAQALFQELSNFCDDNPWLAQSNPLSEVGFIEGTGKSSWLATFEILEKRLAEAKHEGVAIKEMDPSLESIPQPQLESYDFKAIAEGSIKVDEALLDDESFALAAIKETAAIYKILSPRLKDSESILYAMVAADPQFLSNEEIPQVSRYDRKFILKALECYGMQLQSLPADIQDIDMAKAAVTSNVKSLQYVTPELRDNSELMLLAVSKAISSLELVGKTLSESPEFLLQAADLFNRGYSEHRSFITGKLYDEKIFSEAVLFNRRVLEKLIAMHPLVYGKLSEAQKMADPDLLALACREDLNAWRAAPKSLKEDPFYGGKIFDDHVTEFLDKSHWPRCLTMRHMPAHLCDFFAKYPEVDRDDEVIARKALVLQGSWIRGLSARLQSDPEMVAIAVAEDSLLVDTLTPELLDNEQVAIASASRHPETLLRFSARIREDKKILLQIASKCPAVVQYAAGSLQSDPDLLACGWRDP